MLSINRKSFFLRLSIISIVVSSGLLIWASPRFAGSFSIGCIAMMLNFYALFSLMEGIFQAEGAKAAAYVLLLMGKFLILGLGIWIMVRYMHMDLLGLGLGFFLIAISATYATSSLQKKG